MRDAWLPQRRRRRQSHMATSHLYGKLKNFGLEDGRSKLQEVKRSRYTKLSRRYDNLNHQWVSEGVQTAVQFFISLCR